MRADGIGASDAEGNTMTVVNFMTSVSRPYNLPRMLHSIREAARGTKFRSRWILVFDAPGPSEPWINVFLDAVKDVEIQPVIYTDGPNLMAVKQKNEGLSRVREGYFLCLDDDNIVHPEFLRTVEAAMSAAPEKRGFIVGQRRWDHVGDLVAAPDRVRPGQIDSAMFLLHMDVIGKERYDLSKAVTEDGHFIETVYNRNKDAFIFIGKQASYFNYLRVDR